MTIQQNIIHQTALAVKELYGQYIAAESITLQQTRKEFNGDITLVVFPIIKLSKKNPDQTATEIGDYLTKHISDIVAFNVVKGFLNLEIADKYWVNQFISISTNPNYGVSQANGQKVMVEYSSPNTNKPLHLGHVRNNLLGYSVAAILEASGYEVFKVNLVNDRGIHICKSMLAWQKYGNSETPQSSGTKGDHLVGKYYVLFDKKYKEEVEVLKSKGITEEDAKKQAPILQEAQEMLRKWEQGDKDVLNLWKKMNAWVYEGFNQTYANMGVDFKKYYYESDTYLLGKEIIEEGLAKGVFYKKEDNSVWIDLTADGLDEKLVLRSDGTSVYITQDLGTAQLKYDDFKMDKSVYVVGNEQDYHFKVLFLILDKLGKSWAKGLYHLSYGMVDLPSGKMKSREGTVVDADDLMAEMVATAQSHTEELGKVEDFSEEEKNILYHQIGMGALKYHLLKVDPKKRLLFDPKESIDFQGHTGPFIQYTHARICSILRKAESTQISLSNTYALNADEKEVLKSILDFGEIIKTAAEQYSPATIANYVYEVAKLYNKFYHDHSVLKATGEQLAFRLALSKLTAHVLHKGMSLLGIQAPEKM